MSLELRWVVDPSPACFHVVDLLLRNQQPVAHPLAEALAPAAAALGAELDGNGVSRSLFLSHLVPLSASFGGNRQLAGIALTKVAGPQRTEQRIDRLAEIITQIESAGLRAQPDLRERLAGDLRPLQKTWDESGLVMIHSLRRLVEENLVVPRADVIAVPPIQNGGGAAHFLYNSVRIEVLPADPVPELPEVVRLTWLLAQLNADLPMYQGEVHRDRLARVAGLALLPATMAAAVELELVSDVPRGVERALTAWRLQPADAEPLSEMLLRWWETWQTQRPNWSIALAALDRLLA